MERVMKLYYNNPSAMQSGMSGEQAKRNIRLEQ